MNSLKKKALDTIHKYRMILPGEKIAVAVSGGPDSMALLYLLHDLREELACTLHIAHLDHSLRGEESKADALYVKRHARKLGLPITVEIADVPRMIDSKESIESGARRIRYEFYERVMASINADKLAQGHTVDDQAETILMRLLRGSGAQGLGGIPPVRDGKFIRPLIEIRRSEINEYLHQLKLKPRQDSSNFSTKYERNKLRLELIPRLEQEYSPGIKNILCQTGEILRTEDELLTELAQEAMSQCAEYLDGRTIKVRISYLKKYHLSLQRRIFRLVIRKLAGDLRSLDYDHTMDLLDLTFCGAVGSIISLPRGISAEKTYDAVILRHGYQRKGYNESFDYRINFPGETRIMSLALLINTTEPERVHGEYRRIETSEDKFRATFDYDRICGDLRIRNRRTSDKFQPLGMSGTKKLKDFFIDEKVPKASRDSVPILTDSNNILWVVGYRMDDRFKITANTKTQITVTATFF